MATALDSLRDYVAHSEAVNRLATWGDLLAASDLDRRVVVWRDGRATMDVSVRSEITKARIDRVRSLRFDGERRRVYVCAGERLYALDTDSGLPLWSYRPRETLAFLIASPLDVALLGDGRVVATSDNGYLDVWDADGGRLNSWYENDAPTHLCSTGSCSVVVGSESTRLTLYDIQAGVALARFSVVDRIVNLCGGGSDRAVALRTLGAVEIRDVETGEQLASFPTAPGAPTLAFCASRALVAFSDGDGLTLGDTSGRLLDRIELPAEWGMALALAFTPDGSRLYAGFRDGVVRVLEL